MAAIYWFARTADDLADEGDADAAQRLRDLQAYRADLYAMSAGQARSARWAGVFAALAPIYRQYALPLQLLDDLLDAFMQDLHKTRYADRLELLDYCRRSANPVGRLLLHLYGVTDAEALRRSDAICTSLQLINFWQDPSRDVPNGRCYAPAPDLARHGLSSEDWLRGQDSPASQALLSELCGWARELMDAGAPLVHQVPGRAGWELRLVVQGGLRILEKITAMDFATLQQRPALKALDSLPMIWRALRMRRPQNLMLEARS